MPFVHTVPSVFIQLVKLSRPAPLYHPHEVREIDEPFRRATGRIFKLGKLGVVIGRWSGNWSGNLLEVLQGEELGEWRPAGSGAGNPAQPEDNGGPTPPDGAAWAGGIEPDWDYFD